VEERKESAVLSNKAVYTCSLIHNEHSNMAGKHNRFMPIQKSIPFY